MYFYGGGSSCGCNNNWYTPSWNWGWNSGCCGNQGWGNNNNYSIILVLFILLVIIIGARWNN